LGYDRFIAPLNHEFASDTDEESKLITKFIEQKCRCVRSCSDVFSADELRIMRAESKALDYNENNVNRLDVAILSELRALTATGTDTVSSKKHILQIFGPHIRIWHEKLLQEKYHFEF